MYDFNLNYHFTFRTTIFDQSLSKTGGLNLKDV